MQRAQNKKGFTLTEIMVALIILAVLSALAIPAYFRTVEQARANEALANLNIIHMAEKIYRINNNVFWGSGGATNVQTVNAALNTDMSATFYTTVNITLAGVPPNDSYTATFTRNNVSGGAGTKTFTYTFTNGTAAPVLTEGGAY